MSHDDMDRPAPPGGHGDPGLADHHPDVADHAPSPAHPGGDHDPGAEDEARDALPSVVDWRRTARRMRAMVLGIGSVVITAWLAIGLLGTGLSWPLLGELTGFGLLAVFASEVVIVGGSAVAGMLRAGERGDRLSGNDVSLLPPQLTRRRRR